MVSRELSGLAESLGFAVGGGEGLFALFEFGFGLGDFSLVARGGAMLAMCGGSRLAVPGADEQAQAVGDGGRAVADEQLA